MLSLHLVRMSNAPSAVVRMIIMLDFLYFPKVLNRNAVQESLQSTYVGFWNVIAITEGEDVGDIENK